MQQTHAKITTMTNVAYCLFALWFENTRARNTYSFLFDERTHRVTSHLRGARHSAALQRSFANTVTFDRRSQRYDCKICAVSMSSEAAIREHLHQGRRT
jgi:hypothetical protein